MHQSAIVASGRVAIVEEEISSAVWAEQKRRPLVVMVVEVQRSLKSYHLLLVLLLLCLLVAVAVEAAEVVHQGFDCYHCSD